MNAGLRWTSFLLILCSGMAVAEAEAAERTRCQKLATEFAEKPDTLTADQLKQLQFCVTQALKQRYETNPPGQLKGTIMDLPSSMEAPDTTPPVPSPPPADQ